MKTSDKPNYAVLLFESRVRGYDPTRWEADVPGVILLFGVDGSALGRHYRKEGHWYSADDWAQIADEYSITWDGSIGYTLDLREVVQGARDKIAESIERRKGLSPIEDSAEGAE